MDLYNSSLYSPIKHLVMCMHVCVDYKTLPYCHCIALSSHEPLTPCLKYFPHQTKHALKSFKEKTDFIFCFYQGTLNAPYI